MNENTFQSQKTHTRVKFSPLSTSCSLICITPQSPAAQSINTTLTPVQYEPDRSLTPTVILPDVRATDPDDVFPHGAVNSLLALDTIQWYVDGKKISEVWTAADGTINNDYTILTTEDDMRGALKIYKNFSAGTKAVISFKGSFLDWRTGNVLSVESNDMPLTCTDRGENIIKCHADKAVVEYDPLYDSLLLYDYKVANGITVSGSRDSYKDGKSFEQNINVVLTDGTTQLTSLPSDVTMQLVSLGSSTPITPNSEVNPEVTLIQYPNIAFDMRMIDKSDYEVQFLRNSKVIASQPIGLHTKSTMPTSGKPVYGSDVTPSQKEYFNRALVNLAKETVDYPELYYMLVWHTRAQYNDAGTWKYAEEKTWQRGVNMECAVEDLDIGVTQNDCMFDIYFNVDAHNACQLLTDEDGNVLTDEDGNMLMD